MKASEFIGVFMHIHTFFLNSIKILFSAAFNRGAGAGAIEHGHSKLTAPPIMKINYRRQKHDNKRMGHSLL